MNKPVATMLMLAGLVSVGYPQDQEAANTSFTLTWTEGKCLGCKTAAGLGDIQAVSRSEVWAVGYNNVLNAVETILVHSVDAGRTWIEVPRTSQVTDPDGQLAFSFLDAARGWVSKNFRATGEPEMISTRDGGQHWQRVSQQFLQNMQFMDDSHGFGTVGDEFLRTDDGGRTWVKTWLPDILFIDRIFIDRMVFLAPDIGWIASTTAKDLLVLRTINGGRNWEESRTTTPKQLARVRDLFFLDQQRGWLTVWNSPGEGSALYSTVDGGKHWARDPALLFEGKGKGVDVVRFISRERGFVFFSEGGRDRLAFTTDGGRVWNKRPLPSSVGDCRVFEGDLLCTSGPGFRVLTIHPK